MTRWYLGYRQTTHESGRHHWSLRGDNERLYGRLRYTFTVGEVDRRSCGSLEYTRASLEAGVKEAVTGNRVGDISHAVQTRAESGGYSVVRTLVGHGLGKHLHEGPEVPNFGKRGTGPRLERNLVICIEPMINLGTKNTHVQIRVTVRQVTAIVGTFEYAVAVRDTSRCSQHLSL